MIDIMERTYGSFLHTAQIKASGLQQAVLTSYTKEITAIDLLAVFSASKYLNKNRTFWMDSTGEFAFIGIGAVKQIATEADFGELQEQWESLLEGAIIDNPYGIAGTGIVSVGGMSFDPLGEGTKLWENYPTNQLTVPEFFIVENNKRYFLTVNQYIDETDVTQDMASKYQEMNNLIENASRQSTQVAQRVIEKQEIEKEQWKETVAKAVEEIRQGHAKKIVLAREMRLKLNKQANISSILKNLIDTQPNSYIFAIESGEDCFIGATPERLVKIEGKQLLSTCLAGTAPRGETAEADREIGRQLLQDHKNLEEHDYVVKMIRKNIEDLCETVKIPEKPVLFPLRNLQHLYTPVSAILKKEYTIFDCLERLHPTPALGGVPRKESLAFIRKEEGLDRGWYGAPIGWMDSNENSEFAVAIRSGLIRGEEVSLFAGCGVMRDSDPEMEYEETNVKFLPMLHALEVNDEL